MYSLANLEGNNRITFCTFFALNHQDRLPAHSKKTKGRHKPPDFPMVRMRGLEPPRSYPPDPKSGASANSATSAYSYHT